MIFCVGLTGNLASGKSTAANMFAQLGVECISADAINRDLTQKNTPAYKEILTHFGPEVIQTDGQLNRSWLREQIFTQAKARLWLEQLLHPLIRTTIQERVNQSTSAYCLVEIPLHIDKKQYPYINRILLISATKAQQIARVQQRDHCSKEQAQAILAIQPDSKKRLLHADDVIVNDGDIAHLKQQVLALHERYMDLSCQ